jgi:mono/diheme cytochrome c family protein
VKRAVAIASAVAALAASGCGGSPVADPAEVDLQNGMTLFVQRCGGCHALEAAGTAGTQGPNLDLAYLEPSLEGWDRSSFEALVLTQIDKPTKPMPPDLAKGLEAEEIAAYVAQAAARNPDAVLP